MKKLKLKADILLPELNDRCPSSCIAMRRVYQVHKECPNFLTKKQEQILEG